MDTTAQVDSTTLELFLRSHHGLMQPQLFPWTTV